MKYLLQIYDRGATEAPLSAEDEQGIVDEYLALGQLPGVIGGAQLRPVEAATTVRVEGGRRCSRTVRSSTPRSTSAGTSSSRPTIWTRRWRSPRGSRPRGWAARSRCGPCWSGSAAGAGLSRRVGSRAREPGRFARRFRSCRGSRSGGLRGGRRRVALTARGGGNVPLRASRSWRRYEHHRFRT